MQVCLLVAELHDGGHFNCRFHVANVGIKTLSSGYAHVLSNIPALLRSALSNKNIKLFKSYVFSQPQYRGILPIVGGRSARRIFWGKT